MKEFDAHVEFYKSSRWEGFSKYTPISDWGNEVHASRYMQKYWLPEQEYFNVWKSIQDKVFKEGRNLPDLIYKNEFMLKVIVGGCLFLEDDFKQLQNALNAIGEEHFVIIQHTQDYTEGEPMFRMKYPVNISWEELSSGNYISAVLLEQMYNQYFVFGTKGNWGKYSANDYIMPLDILGFKPEIASAFKENILQTNEEKEELQKWIPDVYKDLIR